MESCAEGIRISTLRPTGALYDVLWVRKPYFYERWLFGTTWAARAVTLFEKAVSDLEVTLAHKDAFLSEAEVAVKKAVWALAEH